jgi:hypothetical protein
MRRYEYFSLAFTLLAVLLALLNIDALRAGMREQDKRQYSTDGD